mgnify:CR=1 FL=1
MNKQKKDFLVLILELKIYYDKNGKRLPKYAMHGITATSKFTKLFYKFTIPSGVAKIKFALQTLRNNADIIFDDAFMSIEGGDVLENAQYRVHFNPRFGASIASFVWKEKNFEFTSKKSINAEKLDCWVLHRLNEENIKKLVE